MLGPEHPDTASPLNSLSVLYKSHVKYNEAEPLNQRALSIYEKVDQSKYDEAEPLYKRGLVIEEKVLGPEHPSLTDAKKLVLNL
ncbi:hypothetical protein BC938DRAFT_476987 [Jimgerdemannia flammicorona]|uniref:Tetratricopeptide repeat-domain-containing protein n=1 Tax=Jimgerdemannia flammicorona TaxID=994334 RepID=A0A433PCS4_9FUNG|nr:hypothetical protein BC938DRAFT_476987 [Jimgerdemannia flammicorona]